MVRIINSILGFQKMSPAQKIASSFLLVILAGSFLLTLPIANQNHEFLSWLDALFMATSATCVTGLGTLVVAEQFTYFGQVIMLVLIQVGGLGLMTFMAAFLILMKNRLSLNEKIAMKEMLNRDSVNNLSRSLLDILRYTLVFESVGAILIAFVMVRDFGWKDGIFKAVFLSISAFCNAGFDTLGGMSLQAYVHDPLICITIMSLVVLGGIGFAVWFDVRDKIQPLLSHKITMRKFIHSLSLHTKLVVIVTVLLIVIPAVLIILLEYHNAATLGTFTLPEKIMSGLFESISLRTAGFTSINYANLHISSDLLMMFVMFIGGSPGGTAGGIKTTTMAVLVIYIINMLKGRKNTVILNRTIHENVIIHAMGIFFINLVTLMTGIFVLCIVENQPFQALCFEAVSAMATVGSSLGITASLTAVGKLVIIFLMYSGRIGISTLIISLVIHRKQNRKNKVNYPDGNIIVG